MNSVSATEVGAFGVTSISEDTVAKVRRQMFLDLFSSMEAIGIRYVVLAGHEGYPDRIDSDVDFMVSENDFDRLPALFLDGHCVPGASLVQVLRHETSGCYYVLARQVGSRMAYLHADAAANYRRRGRLWLESERVLSSRRKGDAGFWVPAPDVEFEYYLVKRIDKGLVGHEHLTRLALRFGEDSERCLAVLNRLFPAGLADSTARAILRADATWFAANGFLLRRHLRNDAPREAPARRIAAQLGDLRRKLDRIAQPTGFVVCVLGPDGAGKSTVLDRLEQELAPSFRRVRRFHLRPHLGSARRTPPCTVPHGQPPRGRLASYLKLIYFVADYWFGWLMVIAPARIRSTLVLFDRYYHDLLVDPQRYRFDAQSPVPRWIQPLIPRPDLWLMLTADPDVLFRRKGEVDPSTGRFLADRYAALAADLESCFTVSTDDSIDATLARTIGIVREGLEQRTRARLAPVS